MRGSDNMSDRIKCKKFGSVSIKENCQYCAYSNDYSKRYGLDCDYIIKEEKDEDEVSTSNKNSN